MKKILYKGNKGITLIALVITIIVLLILSGVAIATLTGENGLFTRAKQAKENYSINSAKEKIELAISDLIVEQRSKGENLTKEDLTKINSNEIDVKNTNNFPVEAICQGYKFYIDENFIVTYVGEANETIITYTTEPEGYTNQDKVKILVKISNTKGIKSIQKPGETDKILTQGQTEVGIDYEVIANGTYTFKVVDNENKEVIKDIVIDKFDIVKPEDFTPTVEKIGIHEFTVISNAKDGEVTEISTKSGIEKLEYYIKKKEDIEYIKYESQNTNYKFSDLEGDTEYDFYVIAFDRAGNYKESNVISQKTDCTTKKIYIDSNNGNDITGCGTEDMPYQTLNKISETGIIETGIKYNIYLKEGEYLLTEDLYNLDCNKEINIYGQKEKTILNVGSIFGTSQPEGSEKYCLNLYRLVWKGFESTTNTILVKTPMKLYNIAFVFTFTKNNIAGGYFVDTNGIYMQNCTLTKRFYGAAGGIWKESDSGFIRGINKIINSYGGFKSGYATIDSMWNYKTNYITNYDPKVDLTTYRITDDEEKWKNVGTGTNPDGSQANLGVYGGEYSWEN